jgi:curved DNA-binding protein CbpA
VRDFYKTLRISPNATIEEIKHSFRVLAHQYHPDKNDGSTSSLFMEVKDAYDVLIDPIKRQQYNENYKQHFGNYYTDFENIETESEVKNNSDVNFIFLQLKKFQSNNYETIVLEELSKSLEHSYSRLNSIRQNNLIRHGSYLDLSSTIVRNALEIAEKLLNDLFNNCIINPDQTFKKFPPAARFTAVLSWIEDVIKYIMFPLEKFDMNLTTKEIFQLKKQYYLELNENFKKQANQKEVGKGCYIATMIYGNYDHSNVLVLRNYRDTVLEKKHLGRHFIKLYYFVSPTLAKKLEKSFFLNSIIKSILDKFVHYLNSRT